MFSSLGSYWYPFFLGHFFTQLFAWKYLPGLQDIHVSWVIWQVAQLSEHPTHSPLTLTCVKLYSSQSSLQVPFNGSRLRLFWQDVQKVDMPEHVRHEESQGLHTSIPLSLSYSGTVIFDGHVLVHFISKRFSFIPDAHVLHWFLFPSQVSQLSEQGPQTLERIYSSATQPYGHCDRHSFS